jgi:hypothetical protein
MTNRDIETKLTTHATTAGITRLIYGWGAESNYYRDGVYPIIVVVPINLPLKIRADDVDAVTAETEVWVIDKWAREDAGTTERTEVWDNCNTKAVAFFQAVNGSDDFLIKTTGGIPVENYPDGLNTDQVVGVKYSATITVYC